MTGRWWHHAGLRGKSCTTSVSLCCGACSCFSQDWERLQKLYIFMKGKGQMFIPNTLCFSSVKENLSGILSSLRGPCSTTDTDLTSLCKCKKKKLPLEGSIKCHKTFVAFHEFWRWLPLSWMHPQRWRSPLQALWHLLSIMPLLLLCVTYEKNILEQIKGSEGLYIFMRLKCQTAIQTSVQSDTWATVESAAKQTAKTQLNLGKG